MAAVRTLLGVDAGGTKTHCLVGLPDGRMLGFGAAGVGNHQAGPRRALREISRAVTRALRSAGLEQVDLGVYALAGADLPSDYDFLSGAIEQHGHARARLVLNDSLAALRSGASWGVAVTCGSGINAAGRSPDGRQVVMPGLGWHSGDWGGGHDLGVEAIRAVMRARDGRGEPTLLTQRLLQHWSLPDEEALLVALSQRRIGPAEIRALPQLIFEVEGQGDPAARAIVERLAGEVGLMAVSLIRRLGLGDERVPVVITGGVLQAATPTLDAGVLQRVLPVAPRAHLVRPARRPVVGAVLMALEEAGQAVNEPVLARLEASLPAEVRWASGPAPAGGRS